MANWSVEFTTTADKDLEDLDYLIRDRVIAKIRWLSENFDSVFPIRLTGEFRSFNKLRAGDWRVFYKVDWEKTLIKIHHVEHRNKAYKKKQP